MKLNTLDTEEIENIEDCIPQIEKMYHFRFEKGELEILNSYEEFCNLIITKIKFENIEDCSTQQAFYKIRNSIVEENIFEKNNIKLSTELKNIFPRKNRIELVKRVEKNIGFNLDILRPPEIIYYSLMLILIISFIILFINWKIGFVSIAITVFGFYCCKWFGKEFEVDNVKELVEKITSENYLEIRRQKNTVNKSELKDLITNWFVENAGIEKERLLIANFN